jgi:hypothetical protein
MTRIQCGVSRNVMRPLAASLALALPIVAFAAAAPIANQTAANVAVTTCADAGTGSLREVFGNAVDSETIDLSQLHCSPITLATGELVTSANNLQVVGPTAGITIDAANHSRIFKHIGNGALDLSHLTLTRGSASDSGGGGCVITSGDLVAHDSTFSSCTFSGSPNNAVRGGAIFALGNVKLYSSSVTGNRLQASNATADGGGIFGTLVSLHYSSVADNTIVCAYGQTCRGGGVYANAGSASESTISGNRAYNGAGIYSVGFFTVDQSTISGNRAGDAAGGLFLKSNGQIIASTIAFNTAVFPAGAGIYIGPGATGMIGTIIARNTVDEGLTNADIAGTPGATLAGTNNIVMASTLTLTPNTAVVDPLLGPLQFNGGTTKTHAPDECSLAVSHGSTGSETHLWDQRGPPFKRVIGSAIDIGAIEFLPDFIFNDGFEGGEARPSAPAFCI